MQKIRNTDGPANFLHEKSVEEKGFFLHSFWHNSNIFGYIFHTSQIPFKFEIKRKSVELLKSVMSFR